MMLVTNLDAYPTILVTFQPSDWCPEQVKRSLRDLVASMEMVASSGYKFELLIKGDKKMGSKVPPLYVFTSVVKALISNRELLRNSLLCTGIYTPSEHLDKMIKHILSLYTPTRPLQRFDDLEKAQSWILEQRLAGHQAANP